MIQVAALLYQPFLLRWRYRSLGLRVGMLSLCEDVQFARLNVIHNFVRLRNVELGDLTYVANNATIVNARIGKFGSIGSESRIGLGMHPATFASSHPAFYSRKQRPDRSFAVHEFEESRRVEVGNDVWVGARAMIMDGVKIGDGAIVGAGAVVTRDVPAYAIVAGVPAKLLRYRFDEATIAALQALRWWDRDLDWIRAHASEFSDVAHLLRHVAQFSAP